MLELERYGAVKRSGNWTPRPDSSLERCGGGRIGADLPRGALDLLRATDVGCHGYARAWPADNPELTVELLNRFGYWSFPPSAERPDAARPGGAAAAAIVWKNRGVGRACRPSTLGWRLDGRRRIEIRRPEGNVRWAPGAPPTREPHEMALPAAARARAGR